MPFKKLAQFIFIILVYKKNEKLIFLLENGSWEKNIRLAGVTRKTLLGIC